MSNQIVMDELVSMAQEILKLKSERDELLAALKKASDMLWDWGSHIPTFEDPGGKLFRDRNEIDAAIEKADKS